MSAHVIADDAEALAVAAALAGDHGGADMSAQTLAEIVRLLGTADAGLARIPQGHFAHVKVIRCQGTEEQGKFFFAELLAGRRFGNAQSEAGSTAPWPSCC